MRAKHPAGRQVDLPGPALRARCVIQHSEAKNLNPQSSSVEF